MHRFQIFYPFTFLHLLIFLFNFPICLLSPLFFFLESIFNYQNLVFHIDNFFHHFSPLVFATFFHWFLRFCSSTAFSIFFDVLGTFFINILSKGCVGFWRRKSTYLFPWFLFKIWFWLWFTVTFRHSFFLYINEVFESGFSFQFFLYHILFFWQHSALNIHYEQLILYTTFKHK